MAIVVTSSFRLYARAACQNTRRAWVEISMTRLPSRRRVTRLSRSLGIMGRPGSRILPASEIFFKERGSGIDVEELGLGWGTRCVSASSDDRLPITH